MGNINVYYVVIGVVLLLGLCNNVCQILRVRYKKKFGADYLNHADLCIQKIQKNQNDTSEFNFILMNSKVMSDYIGESLYTHPSLDFANYIKNGNLSYLPNLQNIYYQLQCRYVEECGQYNREVRDRWLYFINPFVIFYLGIEAITRIVFGYILTSFKPDFDFKGTAWKVVNTILSILGSAASIIGLCLKL